MEVFKSTEEYKLGFQEAFVKYTREIKGLEAYFNLQLKELDILISKISEKNFWNTFPKILGIDSKLCLIIELLKFESFSSEEIINIIESDYIYYYKELCGYDLKEKTRHSLIFNIL